MAKKKNLPKKKIGKTQKKKKIGKKIGNAKLAKKKNWQNRKKKKLAKNWLANLANFPTSVPRKEFADFSPKLSFNTHMLITFALKIWFNTHIEANFVLKSHQKGINRVIWLKIEL